MYYILLFVLPSWPPSSAQNQTTPSTICCIKIRAAKRTVHIMKSFSCIHFHLVACRIVIDATIAISPTFDIYLLILFIYFARFKLKFAFWIRCTVEYNTFSSTLMAEFWLFLFCASFLFGTFFSGNWTTIWIALKGKFYLYLVDWLKIEDPKKECHLSKSTSSNNNSEEKEIIMWEANLSLLLARFIAIEKCIHNHTTDT